MARWSRHAGMRTAAAAISRPAAAAVAAQPAAVAPDAPKLADPNEAWPMPAASRSPARTPATPTTSASTAARRSTWPAAAPRARSSACSWRRREAAEFAIMTVSTPARTAPGTPRKRNRIWEYSASWRAAPRAAPRLSPTRAAPASLASVLLAAPVTAVKAAAGSAGRSCRSLTWTCVLTTSGRGPASARKNCCHSAMGTSSTLSGGALGWAEATAPIRWNSESACGRSTTPSTRTCTGAIPARPMLITSPTAACRLAAVCWAMSTPSAEPVR